MRWQTPAALAVVLVALGGFYYLWEVRWAPDREKTESLKGRALAADAKDVTEIAFRRGAETVRLKREGEGWQLVEPVRARAHRGNAESALATLVTAKIDREIAAQPASLAEFGLDKPAAEVTLTLKDGKTLGVSLGGKNPTGVWVYARERDKPAVFVLGESVLREATRPVADLRDRSVLAFDRKDVSALEVVTPDATLAVERDGQRWKLTRPVALRADTEVVEEFLGRLLEVQVKEFVDDTPKSLAPWGLDRPIRLTVVTGREKDRTSRALLVGRFDDKKKGVYAMRPGESSVVLVPEALWNSVPRTVAALRNRAVVEFDRDKLARVELENAHGKVALANEDNRWKIVAPEPLAADPSAAGSILARLLEMRAQGFLTDDASGIPRWLAKPAVRVTLTPKDGGAPTTVLLAPSPEKRGGSPTAYAGIEGRGPVVLVEQKPFADLEKLSLIDVRDRRVLGNFEPKDVKRVRVRAGGQGVLLERAGETEWKLVEPARGAAKGIAVDNLLFTLRGLRWTEIAAPKGEDAAKYGLDAPTLEVTALRADGGELATVLVGRREDKRAWVRTKSDPAIYVVETGQLPAPPKLPDDFKG
ncbi:MAG: DUF4340 domain-containing protein [Candidatus Rokuibacteriota bacterium]